MTRPAILLLSAALGCGQTTKRSDSLSSAPEVTRINQGTVASFGELRVGVMRIEHARYTRADGVELEGLTARLGLFPPERELTVGQGSRFDAGGHPLEVLTVEDSPAPGSITVRVLAP